MNTVIEISRSVKKQKNSQVETEGAEGKFNYGMCKKMFSFRRCWH